MFNLVYISQATTPMDGPALLALLKQSREKNSRTGVTGLLLYKDAGFMQALEGEEEVVRALYAKIREDGRHHDFHTLLTITVPRRQFPDWLMGFKNLGDVDSDAVAGYHSLRELPPWVDILPWRASVAMKLLASFNEGM